MPRYDDRPGLLGYLMRFLVMLILLAGIGLVGFAYVGDLSRPAQPRIQPVTLGGM